MKRINSYLMLTAFVCVLALSQQARADAYINGSTSINYDPWTNVVTGTTTTELDYASQDWYQGRINGKITDANSNVVASTYANDIDRDGTVSVTMQATGVDQMTYTCTGTHIALADIQDYSQGTAYVDFHNFGYYQSESVYRLFFYPFWGRGPAVRRANRTINLGQTFASTQAKPRVGVAGSPAFNPTSVVKQNGSTDLNASISATPGTQAGDQAIVEITRESGSATFTYIPGTQTTVNLVPGANVNATFTLTTAPDNTAIGDVTFRVRVVDIRRSNGQGGTMSVFDKFTVSADGTTSSVLKVLN